MMWYYILMPILVALGLLYAINKWEKEWHPENASTRWRNMQ